MADESIGGVSISITGDAGPLQASFAAAQSSASAAGARVASAFNEGAAATDQMANAAVSAAAAQAGFAASTERSTEALGHQVTQIQAVSGTIRTLDGNQGIRAAERFLTMIPGLGAALQVAFPVIGAIALFEIFGRLLGKSEELTTAEKDLQSQVEATNKAFTDEAEAIDRVNAKYLGQKFGAAAGAQGEVAAARAQLADLQKDVQKEKDQLGVLATQAQGEILKRPTGGSVIEENYAPKFAAQGEKIQQALAKVATAEKELQLKIFEAGQTALSQAGQQSAAYVALQEEQLKHTSDVNKAYAADDLQQSHAAVSEQIAVLHNRSLAAAETAEEELRVEQAKQKNLTAALAEEIPKRLALIRQAGTAESQGKPESDQSRIELQTQTKLESAQADADRQTNEQYLRVRAAQATAAAATATAIRDEAKAQKDFNLELEHEATLWKERTAKASEFQAKFNETLTGVHPESIRQEDKVEPVNQQALQRLQGGNAVQQQLALAIQFKQVGIETNNEIQSRIGNLQNELAAAERLNVPIAERLKLEKEILEARIAAATANGQTDQADKLAAANVALQQTLTQWKALDLGDAAQTIEGTLVKIPATLADAISKGIFDHQKGQNVGTDIAKAFAGLGKQLFGQLLTEGFEKLIATLLGQGIFASAQTTATTANTAALIANTAAVTGSGGASAAGGIAGGVGSAAGTAGAAAATGGASLIAPIIGGIISGVISAAATFIGDAGIIKAVNATTAAVLSLHQTVATGSATNGSSQPSLAAPSQSIGGQIAASLFTALTGAGALDVNVVSISPIAIGAGFLHMFGFASGTSSAPGGWSLIGEKGPELMNVPRGAQIVPNHAIKSYADGTPGYARSYGGASHSTSIGELHVHAHGVSNPDAFAKAAVAAIPREIKRQTSKASPYSN